VVRRDHLGGQAGGAAPDRTEAMTARRVAVNEISRDAPAARRGGAGGGPGQLDGGHPGGMLLLGQGRGRRWQHRPGGRPGTADGGLGFFQGRF
jgi:hypothetical protein